MKYMEWMRMRCELEILYGSGDDAGLADALHEWSETIRAQQSPAIQQAYAAPDERIPLEDYPVKCSVCRRVFTAYSEYILHGNGACTVRG